MACVTACPSGVQYDKLIEDTRAQVERDADAPARRAPAPRGVFALFPAPRPAAGLVPLLALAAPLGAAPRCAARMRRRPPARAGASSRRRVTSRRVSAARA